MKFLTLQRLDDYSRSPPKLAWLAAGRARQVHMAGRRRPERPERGRIGDKASETKRRTFRSSAARYGETKEGAEEMGGKQKRKLKIGKIKWEENVKKEEEGGMTKMCENK